MLDTAFPRPVGDVGNADSWPFPVLKHVVEGATARGAVEGDLDLYGEFLAGAMDLADRGAAAIITSCGFLIRLQADLAKLLPVPVATSSLLQVPMAAATLAAPFRVGVISYDARSLTPDMLEMAGADPLTPVEGLPVGGAFHRMIEHGAPYDRLALQDEVLETARRLWAQQRIGAVVLECTNLPPFANAVRAATGCPVYDILTLGRWLYAGATAR